MEQKSEEKYILRNYWEDIVMDRVRSMISKMDMCQCEKCYLDICALVLSQLPPKYVTTKKGNLMAKVPIATVKNEVELTVLISNSAKMVRDRPMH